MNIMKKYMRLLDIRLHTVQELFSMLWRRKIWWGIPIVFLLLLCTVLLLAAGATGTSAFIYPLF